MLTPSGLFFEYRMIQGLTIWDDFIDEEIETRLLGKISEIDDWDNALKRRVKCYEGNYNCGSRQVETGFDPIPDWLERLINEITAKVGMNKPTHVIINEYQVGQGASQRTDSISFGDCVHGLSLGSDANMVFTRIFTNDLTGCLEGVKKREVKLKRRSLIEMCDECRWDWKHSIPARKTDPYIDELTGKTKRAKRQVRYSITFRKLDSN